MKSFENENDQELIDLLFNTNASIFEMSRDLYKTEVEVRKRIKELGLGWVRKRRGFASRGQATLTAIMHKLLPGEKILSEYPLGERLKLDVYCSKYDLAAEYHGRQHFEYNEFFHGDIYGFEDSKRRDERKQQLCTNLGIALVVFRYNDILTEDAVFLRLLDAIQHAPPFQDQERVSQFKGNPYYESYQQRQREYRKRQYRKMKGYGRR